jgi:hypothetical protein
MVRLVIANYAVPYSEILRVVGAYVDNTHLNEVRIIETDNGLILQGLAMQGMHMGEVQTYQLTLEDIEAMILDARAQRARKM